LTARCCAASADITVKIVVPTRGNRLVRRGVKGGVAKAGEVWFMAV
jgi:hypothetical protein